jgi:CRP-like cAMP-binding protein/Fe-S-cluster-containing hydrogenase component 2
MSAKKIARRLDPATERAAHQSWRRQEALTILATLDCLRGVPASELSRLLEMAMFRPFQVGARLLGQQRRDRFLFLVLHGTLQLRLCDKDGREVLMGVLGRGDCCGEGPLFGDFFRRMNALAQSNCQLLQVPLAELRAALPSLPMLAAALRQRYKQRMVECTLARVPLLSQLFPMERLALGNLLKPAHAPRGTTVIRQGQSAGALYLIESGQVVVEQSGTTIATLGEGDFFGEMALLTSQPHRADVRALTPTDLLTLPAAEFHALIDQRPDLEAQLRSEVERRLRHSAAMRGDASRARELELAVGRGLLRGSHLLVRTPSLCPPGCSLCEQACKERHGSTRMRLGGVEIDGDDVVDACRQCGVGAECMEACPEDAFERTESGTLLITDRCTGCGACVEACPYDVVTTVPLRTKRSAADPLQLLRGGINLLRGRPVIPLESARPTHRADKCDLCAGHADLACLSRCPTGSLRLQPVAELFEL